MDLENKDTNIEKDTDTKENKTSPEETKETKVENEEVVSVKKADLDALIEKVSKIGDIEKMLKLEQEEKKQLKFENIKQKHNISDGMIEALKLTADMPEEDIVKAVTKAAEVFGQPKDSAVFFKTDTTKNSSQDKSDELFKQGKVKDALNLVFKSVGK